MNPYNILLQRIRIRTGTTTTDDAGRVDALIRLAHDHGYRCAIGDATRDESLRLLFGDLANWSETELCTRDVSL